MSRNLLMAVTGVACAAALLVPSGAAQASERPEIGPCKTKVDKMKSKPKNGKQTAAEKKAAKGGNDEALTTGVTIICK